MNILDEEAWELLRAEIEAQSEPPDDEWQYETDEPGPVVIRMGRVELPPERIAELADLLLREWPEPTDGRRP